MREVKRAVQGVDEPGVGARPPAPAFLAEEGVVRKGRAEDGDRGGLRGAVRFGDRVVPALVVDPDPLAEGGAVDLPGRVRGPQRGHSVG